MNQHAKQEFIALISQLPQDAYFFLMHNYIGPVSTPFHKPQLTEQLTTFFLKPETQTYMCSLITDEEAALISAVCLAQSIRFETLWELFSDSYGYPEFYELALNLTERCIILPVYGEHEITLTLNPLLASRLKKEICSYSFLGMQKDSQVPPPSPIITTELLRALTGYILRKQISRGERGLTTIASQALFRPLKPFLPELLQSMVLLGLLTSNGERFSVNKDTALDLFARPEDEVAMIITGLLLAQKAGKPELSLQAIHTVRILHAYAKQIGVSTPSEFRRMVVLATQTSKFPFDETIPDFLKTVGCVRKQSGNMIFAVGTEIPASTLIINSDYHIHFTGTRTGRDLLFLFAEAKQIDTAMVYEVTKESILAALSIELTGKEILSYLDTASLHNLPSSLRQTILDREALHQDITLYEGLVLCTGDRLRRIIEQHEGFQQFIRKTLAPGIYLLYRERADEWKKILARFGSDTTPEAISEAGWHTVCEKKTHKFTLPALPNPLPLLKVTSFPQAKKSSPSSHFMLQEKLDSLDLTLEERYDLQRRLDAKLIVAPTQIIRQRPTSGIQCASGFDYQGKVSLLKDAVGKEDVLLRITVNNDDSPAETLALVEEMLGQGKNRLARLLVLPSGEKKTIAVGKMFQVRKMMRSFTITHHEKSGLK